MSYKLYEVRSKMRSAKTIDELCHWWQIGIDILKEEQENAKIRILRQEDKQ
jgi:hypothetical protein